MKTTLEIPDELYRQAKVHAAQENRKMKDLVSDGLRLVLGLADGIAPRRVRRMKEPPIKIRKGRIIRALTNDEMAVLLEDSGERLP
jgi:hypothetical protein